MKDDATLGVNSSASRVTETITPPILASDGMKLWLWLPTRWSCLHFKTLKILNPLCIRIIKYPCLRHEPKQILYLFPNFESMRASVYFVGSLLAPYLYSRRWCHQTVAKACLTKAQAFWMPVKINWKIIFPIRYCTYKRRCSTYMFYLKSTKSTQGSCCTLPLAVAI